MLHRHVQALVFATVVLALAACSSSSSSNNSTGMSERAISLAAAHPEATTTSGWLNPKTMQIEVASTRPEAGDMHIDGLLVGWRFVAVTDVQGALQAPPVVSRCRNVWLILEDRSIVENSDGAPAPGRTYLAGRLDPETGLFYPDSKSITRVMAPEPTEEG